MLEHLLKFLRDEQESISKTVNDGVCKDFAEYRYNNGVMKGLVIAEEEIVRLLKREDEEDD